AHRDAYDLVWQLRADEPATLDSDLRQLGAALHLPIQNADAPTARRLVLGWLNGSNYSASRGATHLQRAAVLTLLWEKCVAPVQLQMETINNGCFCTTM
ncbi:MAG: hypothetical protein GY803_14280, partial [Chloroflexi bacterium]|nr:hypothetical protein [Chloroflexota bacterium]